MYGGGYNNYGAGAAERATDNWINQNIPGGVNSPLGEQIDNMSGGNPNPTLGQVYGGAPGVGGFGNMNAGAGYPGAGFPGAGFPGNQYGGW